MPRKRRVAKERRASTEVPPLFVHVLTYGAMPPREDREPAADTLDAHFLLYRYDLTIVPWLSNLPRSSSAIWDMCRDEVLATWIRDRPGTRPSGWWRFDAPRSVDGRRTEQRWPEPRCHVGGSGRPMPGDWSLDFGIPMFVGAVSGETVLVESEAAYLARHGLLASAERQQLGPEDFQPCAAAAIVSREVR